MAGRTGCGGICGTEQLAEIFRPIAPLPFTQTFSLSLLDNALEQLKPYRKLASQQDVPPQLGYLPEGNYKAVAKMSGAM